MERNQLRRFRGWVLVFLGFLSLPSIGDCPEAFSKLGSFPAWSNREKNLTLTARDIFPEDYVAEVESKFGRFDIRVMHQPLRGYVAIAGSVKGRAYVRVKLYEDAERAGSMIVDELNLQDPLRHGETGELNLDQSGKGLPPNVFRHVKERLFEIVRAGGFQEIRTHSQQHFGVVQLYKRFVGMEPADEKSKKTLDYLEGLYSFSRRELPEELRPKDVEEFTRWLGSGGLDPSGLTSKRQLVLDNYLNHGTLHSSFTLLKNKNGEVVGALFRDKEFAESNIVFFDPTGKKLQILHWFNLAASHQLELVRKL